MDRLHILGIVLLLFLASCASAPEPPEEVAPVEPVLDAPVLSAVYQTHGDGDGDSAHRFVLALYDDGTARLETRLPDDSPPFLELGEWEQRDAMLLVVITQTRRLDYDEPRPILFEMRGEVIAAIDYDTLFYGDGGMQLSEVDASAEPLLAETSWRLMRLEHSGELYQPSAEGDYTITFAENGTLTGQADCNRVTGLYSDIAAFLTLSSLRATDAACVGESFSDAYVAALRDARHYQVTDGTLVISGEGLIAQFEMM